MIQILGTIAQAVIIAIFLFLVASIATSLRIISCWRINNNYNINFDADFAKKVAREMMELRKNETKEDKK